MVRLQSVDAKNIKTQNSTIVFSNDQPTHANLTVSDSPLGGAIRLLICNQYVARMMSTKSSDGAVMFDAINSSIHKKMCGWMFVVICIHFLCIFPSQSFPNRDQAF